jgi:hypothetical protein
MLMKRFVGGGDDWRAHMDAMVMVWTTTLTICRVLNKRKVEDSRVMMRTQQSNQGTLLWGQDCVDNTRRVG